MLSTDCKGLSKRPRNNKKRKLLLSSVEEGAESAMKVTAGRVDIFLHLNNHKVSKEILKRKLLE